MDEDIRVVEFAGKLHHHTTTIRTFTPASNTTNIRCLLPARFFCFQVLDSFQQHTSSPLTHFLFRKTTPPPPPPTFNTPHTTSTMKGFTFATVAALAATTLAATVKLEQTACIQANATSLFQFNVEVDKLTVINLDSVCGLKLVSANGADVNAIKCQAYMDAEGKNKGSKEFTFADPAQIATNPVQEKAILCVGSGAVPTAQPTTFAAVTTSAALAASTGGASATGSGNGNGNSTSGKPSSPSPSSSSTNAPGEGAASTLSMSLGALSFAAVAALFL
ncbi:hypothetical protein PMIN06_002167 [Paraphaeosphaeria minitans]